MIRRNRTVIKTDTGDGGNIQLVANSLEVTNGAVLNASTLGTGNGGNVVLTIADTARFDGVSAINGRPSFAGSNVNAGAVGLGGNLRLIAKTLEVSNGAQLAASTFGTGDAGDVILEIRNEALFDGTTPNGQFVSGAFSSRWRQHRPKSQ
jgi:large exoprotein involved in heme utilization and adhesion